MEREVVSGSGPIFVKVLARLRGSRRTAAKNDEDRQRFVWDTVQRLFHETKMLVRADF